MDFGTSSLPSTQESGTELTPGLASSPPEVRRVLPTEAAAAEARRLSPEADILSFAAWMRLLWNDLVLAGHQTRILLNAAQEHLLWTAAVSAHPPEGTLQSHDVVAGRARIAYSRAAGWGALADLRRYGTDASQAALLRWVRAFERECDVVGVLPVCRLPEILQASPLEHASFAQALKIEHFELLLPAEQKLVRDLQDAGHSVLTVPVSTPAKAVDVSLVAAENVRQEATAAAEWFAEFYGAHATEAQMPRTGILLADTKSAPEFLSALRNRLAPASFAISSAANSQLQADTPFADTPLISSAFTVLHLLSGTVSLPQLYSLFGSPYLFSNQTQAEISEFLSFSYSRRPSLGVEISFGSLRASVGLRAPAPVLAMLERLHSARSTLLGGATQHSYGQWMELIRRSLSALDWPASIANTSSELALLDVWQGTLDRVATLDFRGDLVDFHTALRALTRLAAQASSAQAPTHTPLRFVTPEEAQLGGFDALWIAGATQEVWPPRIAADPLLPWALQAAHRMPGTSPALAADAARRVTEALLAAAPRVLVSYASTTAEGDQLPSPILAEFAQHTASAHTLLTATAPPPVTLEAIQDATPLSPPPNSALRGGVEVFRAQADCGFRAFAQFRLASSSTEEISLGLDAGDNGSLLHKTLELFWRKIGDQQHLKELTPEEVESAADSAVRSALARFEPPVQGAWEAAYLQMQRERTRRLLIHWLQHEYDRPSPFRVLAQEDEQKLSVDGLDLTIRPDRIDQLEDGSLVLIDYKTGKVQPSAWEGDRPEQPQLPLYAQYFGDRVSAIAFARLRPSHGEMSWRGYTSREGILPTGTTDRQNPADLGERVGEWGATLRQLAAEFSAGHAAVSPRHPEVTCKLCEQRLLCRVDTLDLLSRGGDEDDSVGSLDD